MATYSLVDYRVTIKLPNQMNKYLSTNLREGLIIGGQNSFVESITIRQNVEAFSTKGDSTGSFIHTFNADRTGEIELSISQVSQASKILSLMFSTYYKVENRNAPFKNTAPIPLIEVYDTRNNVVVAKCSDAFIKKHPDKTFTNEAGNESWVFTVGVIEFFPN